MKNLSKVMAVAVLAVCSFASCKKNKNNDVSTSDQIVLSPLQVTGNIVTLKWSKPNVDSLEGYTILRVVDSTDLNGNPTYSNYTYVDKAITEYKDTLPLAPYVQYYVVARRSSTTATKAITSNKLVYARTDLKFMPLVTKDALYDRDNHSLLIYSADGNIVRYDLQAKQITKQIAAQATIGYCDMGTYNGTKELYVPRSDGWLFIYNAATLEQIDQISIGGQLSAVACSNGYLFINSSSNSNVYSYSRATKSQISQTYGSSYDARLRLIPGTNSEFFSATNSSEIGYFKFASNGTYVSSQSTYLSGSYISPDAFEIFPTGDYLISSAAGTIIKKDLTYVASLPHGNIGFTSFDFDQTNQLIYAGCNTHAIQAYSMNNYQLIKTVATQGYPAKIFYDNGSIICVSSSYYYYYSGYYSSQYTFIEQL